jgi:hypothetical protein
MVSLKVGELSDIVPGTFIVSRKTTSQLFRSIQVHQHPYSHLRLVTKLLPSDAGGQKVLWLRAINKEDGKEVFRCETKTMKDPDRANPTFLQLGGPSNVKFRCVAVTLFALLTHMSQLGGLLDLAFADNELTVTVGERSVKLRSSDSRPGTRQITIKALSLSRIIDGLSCAVQIHQERVYCELIFVPESSAVVVTCMNVQFLLKEVKRKQ